LHLDVLEDRCLPSLFAPFTPFPVGSGPESVAVGDFNRDGIPDLAVANFSDTVSVLLGKGDGTFGSAANYAVGSGPESVAVGDLNRDGIPDLVVANAFSNTVSVLLGNGDGTFQSAISYAVGGTPDSVAVGDFNRDGIPDLAVANFTTSTVSVLLGKGDGSFQPAVNYAAASGPQSVAVGDFNRDGITDLAVVNFFSDTVSVLLGNGDGTFGNPTNFPVGSAPGSVTVGDFNRDGIPDLAVTSTFSNTVSVLLGKGDGTFANAYTVGPGSAGVAVGDFNRDGIPDLAVASAGGSTVSVLLGKGDGTFQSALSYAAGSNPVSVAVGDFNGDGAPDLAVTSLQDNAVDVFLNQSPVTSTVVTSNANPAVAGQLVTFTATVTQAVPGGVAPTGLVTFKDDGTVLGTGTLNGSGTATFSTFSLAAGDHPITAVYKGDPNFTTSTSPVVNLVVDQDTTATALGVSTNPGLAGQPITLTATVQGAVPGFGPPTGTVLFMDGTATIGSGSLSGGVATFTTAALAPASHTLSAVYVGDRNFTGSSASAVTEVINNPAPTLTGLSPSSLPEGSAAFTLTLTGSNFVPGATVQWNGSSLTVTNASPTQIQASVPASLLSQEGSALVTVTNPSPGGGTSLTQTFTISDASLAARGVNLNVHGNLNFSGTVATFADGNAGATSADFTAIIVWDDGTASYGTVSGTGPFTVSGTHSFAPFHTLHTISVTILDQGGSSVPVTDNVIDPTPNEAFVMQLYQDLLHRPADADGLAAWSSLLGQGTSRAQVVLDIEQSLEYRHDAVQALYARYLYRNADPAGLAAFSQILAQGGTLEQAAADIVASPEYYQRRSGGTADGFLAALYHDALSRGIDPSGQALFAQALGEGASRSQVAAAIFGSTEYHQDLIKADYLTWLHRPPDRIGLAAFTDALAVGMRDEALAAAILGSDEFFSSL
jgi:hypothetical protein